MQKNSAVALIPATILADTPVTIGGVPNISDVKMLGDLLEEMEESNLWTGGRDGSRSF